MRRGIDGFEGAVDAIGLHPYASALDICPFARAGGLVDGGQSGECREDGGIALISWRLGRESGRNQTDAPAGRSTTAGRSATTGCSTTAGRSTTTGCSTITGISTTAGRRDGRAGAAGVGARTEAAGNRNEVEGEAAHDHIAFHEVCGGGGVLPSHEDDEVGDVCVGGNRADAAQIDSGLIRNSNAAKVETGIREGSACDGEFVGGWGCAGEIDIEGNLGGKRDVAPDGETSVCAIAKGEDACGGIGGSPHEDEVAFDD